MRRLLLKHQLQDQQDQQEQHQRLTQRRLRNPQQMGVLKRRSRLCQQRLGDRNQQRRWNLGQPPRPQQLLQREFRLLQKQLQRHSKSIRSRL